MMKKVLITCLLLLFAGDALAWNCEAPCPKGGKPRKECREWKEVHCQRAHPLDAWGEAGAKALPAAANTMKKWNQKGEHLDKRLKHALRPIFGNLTDKLKITWNARLVDQWAALGHYIPLSGADNTAQAYKKRIYIAQPESVLQSQPGKTLALIIHAATHAQQMEQAKGLKEFGDEYFRAYKRANLQFANNHFEQQAAANAQNHWRAALKRYEEARCFDVPNIEIHTRGQNAAFSRGKTWQNCSGYKFVFQHDANLVLYAPNGAPIWATGTDGTKADRFVVQTDGNVVLYAGPRPLWASDTQGKKTFFAIQEDGNLVVYARKKRALWSSGTEGGRRQTLNAAAEWQRHHAPPKPPTAIPPVQQKPPADRLPFFRQ